MKKRKTDAWIIGLFIVYVLLLVWVVIFKARFSFPVVRPSHTVSLIPFDRSAGLSRLDVVANVFVFIPLGVYLTVFRLNWWRSTLCGFALSLAFELTQYVFKIGVTDTTDLITNTSGTLIGALICLLLGLVLRERRDRVIRIAAGLATAAAVCVALMLWLI